MKQTVLPLLMLAISTIPLPAADQSGQTLLWRETFRDATIDAATPGTLTTVEAGSMLGGLPNGPTWKDDGQEVSWSGAIRNRTNDEAKLTLAVFDGYREIPEEAAKSGMVSLWLRPSSRQEMRPSGFFHLETSQGRVGVGMVTLPDGQVAITTDPKILGEIMSRKDPDPSTYQLIPMDEWVLLWFVYSPELGIELWAQKSPDAGPVRVGLARPPGDRTIQGVRFRSAGSANQGSFAGRIGPAAVHAIQSMDAAKGGPSGYKWPTNDPTVWRVSPDAKAQNIQERIIGGFDNLREALSNNVILARETKAWTTTSGENSGYSTLPDAASMRQWWLDWVDGKHKPMGDRIEFEPGIYRVSSFPIRQHGGMHYTLVPGAPDFSADLRMSESLTESWSQVSADFPRVWQYDGPPMPSRHVWGKDWESFNVFFTTEGKDTAIAALNDRPWACYTDPESGITYISLPDGMTPEKIAPLEGSKPMGFDWRGAWLGKLLIQGGARYKHGEKSGDKALAGYALGVSTGPMITIIEARGLRCSKHPAALVGNSSEGLCIWHKTDVGFDPPGEAPNDPVGFGVGTGAFTPLVDYSSAPTTEENPGRIVTIYDGVTYREPTEPGDGTTNAKPPRRAMYYSHGSSTNAKMFALTVVRDPDPAMFTIKPGAPIPPQDQRKSHSAFEIIE